MATALSAGPAVDASIVIPTFNRLWSLPDALASCPRADNIEIIVVDDGSTDGTWEWLGAQPGIRTIRQSNWGKPAAVNAGVAAARGRYVKFLDSDDLLIGDAVLDQLRFVLAEGADICVAGYVATNEATGARVPHDWTDCGDFLAQQLGECDSSHYSAYFFRRSFLTDVWHRPEFAFRDDRMFILECALKQPSVVAWPAPTLLHRHHARPRLQFQPGSTAVVTNWQELRMYKKVAALLEQGGMLTDRRRAAMANNVWPLALRIAAHDPREGREALDWLWALHRGFRVPATGLSRLYRLFGFAVAQRLVNGARAARNGWRRVAGAGRTGRA